jgi:CRP-like cAMP-binding protein
MMNSTANVETPEVDDFLGCLTPRQLVAIKDQCRVHAFAAGERILVEGEPSRRLYLMRSGTVRVAIKGRQAALLGPGTFFGEIAVFGAGGRTADVVATERVVAWSLAPFIVRPLMREHPELGERMLMTVVARLRRADVHQPA